MEQWVFWPTALLSIGSALVMLISTNAVHSALALVGNFFTLAIFYVLLDAHFLAAAQVVVYAGAIMVLFLFVIMLLGVDREENLDEQIKFHRPIAYAAVFALAAVTVFTVRAATGLGTGTVLTFDAQLAQANASGNAEGVGRVLFSSYLFPFEVTSLLLIVAAIGAMVIGKRRRREDLEAEDEDA